MSVTSADPADLTEFVTTSSRKRAALQELLNTAVVSSNAVHAASADFHPQTTALRGCGTLLGDLHANERFVAVVRDAVVAADRHNGAPVVEDSVVALTLNRQGLLDRPRAVEIEKMSLFGIAPTSGFVDDPICAANGNFVHTDVDLTFPGFASCLNAARTYNSLAHRDRGLFGWGWSSYLDMRLTATVGEPAVVHLADGAAIAFRPAGDGGYHPDQRRRLSLRREDRGWRLTHDFVDSWAFDDDGLLTTVTSGPAVADVQRSDDEIRLTEQLSGRSISYGLRFGVIVAAAASDGRQCRYHYDAEGHLVAVDRPAGRMHHRIQQGLIRSLTDADGVIICDNVYDADGRVLQQTSPFGRTSLYDYDDLGTTRISDTDDGPVNVLVHDRHGNVTSVIDGHGHDMRLVYDTDGRMVQMVDRTGAPTEYEYTESGLLSRRSDPDGLSHSWIWDEQGRLLADTDRAGATSTYEYSEKGSTATKVRFADGTEQHTEIDDRGLPTQVTDPDGVTTQFDLDRDGLLTALTDALGNRHSFSYDDCGQLVEARNPSDVVVRFALDSGGRVVASTTADGTQHFTYSPAGRLTRFMETDGGTWTFRYDRAGEIEELTDAAGSVLRLERNTHGNVITFIAPDGAAYSHEYDDLGRLVRAVDPAGNSTRLEYDAEGRSIAVLDPTGRQWRRTVDCLGRTTTITAPDGSVTTRSYHPNGEPAAATDAEGRTWRHSIDLLGRLSQSIDPAGAVRFYAYSSAGRPAFERSPEGRTVERTFDPAGRVVLVLDKGAATSYGLRPDGQIDLWQQSGQDYVATYDDMGRLAALTGAGVDFAQAWKHGRVTETTHGRGPSRYEWDNRGLLCGVTDPAGVSTTLTRDARGRLVQQVTGNHRAEAHFGDAGYLRKVTDPLGRTTEVSTDEAGRTTSVDLPDGQTLRYTHTSVGLPATVSSGDGTALTHFEYDTSGLLTEARGAGLTTRIERDAVGRVSAVAGLGYALRYGRDRDGLIVSKTDESNFAIELRRSEAGELQDFLLPDGTSIQVPTLQGTLRDQSGRVTRDHLGRRYAYDSAGRLVQAATSDGRSATYSYGPTGLLGTQHDEFGEHQYRYNVAGQLSNRTTTGVTIHYSYDKAGRRTAEEHPDGSSLIYEWDLLGRLTTVRHTCADGRTNRRSITYDAFNCPVLIDGVPIAWDLADSGKPVRVGQTRYLRDGLNVRDVGSATEWQEQLPNDPWGDDNRTGLRLGYRGELALDHLVFMGARVYEPRSRTFLSPDPAAPIPGALTFAGPYSYAWNDPVNYIDPSGLRPLSEHDYDEIRKRQQKGIFEQAWDAANEDPWETLATAGITAVGNGLTFLAGPAHAAAGFAGSGISIGTDLAADAFSKSREVLGGALDALKQGATALGTLAATGGGASPTGLRRAIDVVTLPTRLRLRFAKGAAGAIVDTVKSVPGIVQFLAARSQIRMMFDPKGYLSTLNGDATFLIDLGRAAKQDPGGFATEAAKILFDWELFKKDPAEWAGQTTVELVGLKGLGKLSKLRKIENLGADAKRLGELDQLLSRTPGLQQVTAGLDDAALRRLTNPAVLPQLERAAEGHAAGRIVGLDQWIGFNAAKSDAELVEAAGELAAAERLGAANPGLLVRVGREGSAPIRPGTSERMAEFDLSLESPDGAVVRTVEITTVQSPVNLASDATNGVRHAADKVASRLADGQPLPGDHEVQIRVRLDVGSKVLRGLTREISPDGTVRFIAGDGRVVRTENIFDDVAANLSNIKNNALLDRVVLTQADGAVVATYERLGATWRRLL